MMTIQGETIFASINSGIIICIIWKVEYFDNLTIIKYNYNNRNSLGLLSILFIDRRIADISWF